MSKQKEPAFPHENAIAYHPGLTKLEYFAAAALPAMVTSAYANNVTDAKVIALDTVRVVKALLEELEK